ncbi:MAG: hypothetical protein U9R60_08695 [Bacteroidota bacterium]|nr:hypothetical protein [Bacteroidota bacterium]
MRIHLLKYPLFVVLFVSASVFGQDAGLPDAIDTKDQNHADRLIKQMGIMY